jgi:predicted MFS family arabinose efflux permease
VTETAEADEPATALVLPRNGTLSILIVVTAAMAVAVLPGFCLAVLADPILDELAISRTEFGIVSAVIPGVAAIASVHLGGLADSRGGRSTTILALLLGAASLLAIAGSFSYAMLLGAAVVAGLCQGGATSSTNLVVLESFDRARRGLIVGIKQSGEMLAIVGAGVAIPLLAETFGWRGSIGLAALLPLAAVLVAIVVPRHRRPDRSPAPAENGPTKLPVDVWWLTVYAAIMGLAGGALSTYLPLYAQEGVGMSTVVAGQALALTGLVAIPGRILWGHYAERTRRYVGYLRLLSALAALGAFVFWLASRTDPAIVWAGSIIWGLSQLSWSVVAMLAVLAFALPGSAGRASGAMLVGMSVGLTVGPIVFGAVVDATGTYDLGFAGVIGVLLAAVLETTLWIRRRSTQFAFMS